MERQKMFRDKEILNQVLKQEIMLSRITGQLDGMHEMIRCLLDEIQVEIRSSHEIQEENRIDEQQMRLIIKESIKEYLDATYQDYLKEAQKNKEVHLKPITLKKAIKK